MTAGRGRSVLIVNNWLGGRSGTTVVTTDYALGLARRGWRVSVYSPATAPPDDPLRGRVEIIEDLARIAAAPDIIHGHQHPPLVTAMARFPETPAVQICHSAGEWNDAALALTKVRLHAAVDRACQARICDDLGRETAEVPLAPNAVDLERCRPRGPLPARPARALIVANRDGGHVKAVQEACDRAGVEHRAVGFGIGQPAWDLEAQMAEADVVVGAARIALEAMAVGCAALVCDARGLAGVATAASFEAWRSWNFGFRLLDRPVTVEGVLSALEAYDAVDAAAVSARVRSECGLESALDRLEAAYEAVLASDRARTDADRERDAVALSAYLHKWLPLHAESGPFGPQIKAWREQAQRSEAELNSLVEELERQGMKPVFTWR